jgi:hypothetical protein
MSRVMSSHGTSALAWKADSTPSLVRPGGGVLDGGLGIPVEDGGEVEQAGAVSG